jgi:3-methyladenine DNA glycosylase AlkD
VPGNIIFNDYQKYLNKKFNSIRAAQEKRYLYSDLKHYGLSVPEIKAFFKLHKSYFVGLSKNEALSLIKTLWSTASYEERALALLILQTHKEKLTISDMPFIEKLMRDSKGWVLLDALIIPIMPTILDRNESAYKYLSKWIKDGDFWVRRSALLSQILFFRKGSGDRKLFFKMAQEQFDERWIDNVYKGTEAKKRARFFIRKAIGWALREMSVKNPEAVSSFLKKYKDKMSGLTFREGSKRLAYFKHKYKTSSVTV